MEAMSAKKRERDASGESLDFSEVKRLRAHLLDILDDDTDACGDVDLDCVMRTLEREIGVLAAPPPSASVAGEDNLPDIGYLLEASDDELGLPPTVTSSSEDEATAGEVFDGRFGQIWGISDEFPVCFDELEFPAFRQEWEDESIEKRAEIDGGLFDFSDFTDFSLLPESLPAV
ncbi:hypothetical protein AXF42_Ash005415 [Apostasia shenzhenica]|uniref:Uncharacterized protein n=1 Tax=Apostasia shenzhenica TaxID=1088818 RepID=A0A2I0B6W4_9ASPA|nr:hypothetical protein AXF42_Ash005415 [Apostasia shenzhenica]